MAMTLANNLYKSARQVALINARISLDWARKHMRAGEIELAAQCWRAAQTYRADQRRMSREQKKIAAEWAMIAENAA